jgi:hypothetical protein
MLTEWAVYFVASLATIFLLVGVGKKMAFFTLLSFGLWLGAALFSPMVFTGLGEGGAGVLSPEFALLGYLFVMIGVVTFLVAIAQAFDKI